MARHTKRQASIKSRYDFPAFLASLFLSKIADQILLFLVPLVVFQATQDVKWSGLAFAAEAFPRFISFPICGALCDRVSPVRLMRLSQMARAITCIVGAIAGEAFDSVTWLIFMSAVCGVLTTQGAMAREVILPQAFKDYRFERVLAYSQTADQLGAVLGPVLAAMLFATTSWQSVTGVAAAIFLVSDGAMGYWRKSSTVPLSPRNLDSAEWVASMRTAMKHIMLLPGLRKLVIQAAGVNLVVGVTLASSAALFTGMHVRTSTDYAVLQTAGAVVTIIILMSVAHIPVSVKKLGFFGFSLVVIGGLLTAFCSTTWGYIAGYLLIIGFDKMFNIYLRSTRQRIIPAADFGKTAGVMTLLNNISQPLAGLAVGILSARWTPNGVILLLTIGMAVLGGLSMISNVGTVKRRAK